MLVRILLIFVALLFITGSLSIAYIYESQTLWYKIGTDRIVLRAGQLAGLLAAALICVQIVLGVRGKFLEKFFSVASLMSFHRGNGVLIGICVVLHVLMVLIPEGISNLPMGLKHWPEMVGGLLLWLILAMVISSRYRDVLKLDYKKWRKIHKLLAYLVPLLLAIHIYFVSDSFQQTVPRVLLFLCFGLLGFWIVIVKFFKGPKGE